MATESSIFYDPFANRTDKFDPLDTVSKFDSKFSKEREAKNGITDSGSNNGEDSQKEVQKL